MTSIINAEIRTRPHANCSMCGAAGKPLHPGIRDHLFGVQGQWNLVRCSNVECGLSWPDPMPIEEDIGKAYQTYYTHASNVAPPNTLIRRLYAKAKTGYLAKKFGYLPHQLSITERLLGAMIRLHPGKCADLDFGAFYLQAHPSARLLEVGCGGGYMLSAMQQLGWQTDGVDFDPVAVQNAKAKGLNVYQGDLVQQQFPASSYDAVVTSHVIEHVYDPLAMLQESYRLLKPGGKLVIVTPNTNSLGHRIYGRDWRGLEPPRHLHLFTSSALRNLCQRAGFEDVIVNTTIRDANGMIVASHYIHHNKPYVMGHPQPLVLHMYGRLMQLFEWGYLKMNREIGEEIALIATKK